LRFEGNRRTVDAPWPLKSTSMLVEKLEKHAASAGGNFFQNHLIGMRFDKKKNAESVPILVPMPQEVTINYPKNKNRNTT